jgi:hypothetical protein
MDSEIGVQLLLKFPVLTVPKSPLYSQSLQGHVRGALPRFRGIFLSYYGWVVVGVHGFVVAMTGVEPARSRAALEVQSCFRHQKRMRVGQAVVAVNILLHIPCDNVSIARRLQLLLRQRSSPRQHHYTKSGREFV